MPLICQSSLKLPEDFMRIVPAYDSRRIPENYHTVLYVMGNYCTHPDNHIISDLHSVSDTRSESYKAVIPD